MPSAFLEVLSGSPEAVRAQLDAAVIATLDEGKDTLTVSVDALRELDDAAIAATVRALRRLRAVGGTLRLVTQRDDHRERLAVTGLDRVFDVYDSKTEADARATDQYRRLRDGRRLHMTFRPASRRTAR